MPTPLEKLQATMRLVNAYKIHNPNTGFLEWKPDTPDYVKQAEKGLYEPLLDKSASSGIMTTERGGRDDDRNELQPIGTGSQSPRLHPAQQEEGLQRHEQGRDSGMGEGEGGGSEGLRRDADGDGAAGLRGMGQSHSHGDTGVGQRLATQAPPKDIVLNQSSEIGHNAGAATRFDANLEAIRTLKRIEDEHRPATPEEQATLTRYSGFGDSGMGEAFPAYEYGNFKNTPWGRRREELKALTTEDEFKAIEKSRLNAFYTTPEVINHMWKALDRMGVGGLKNPRILEPSAGSGRFLGYQPSEIAVKSQRVAVELDSLTGRILKHIYPQADTYIMGFEKAPIPKDSIDVAISNVPFGNYPIFDPTFKKDRKRLTHSIHNYFFAKTLEDLRPGGVLAFITSHETLDAPTAKPVRQALASQADMVGAIRLPNNAFPDTKVVTDIIFMRKRMPGEEPGDQSWVNTTKQTFNVTSRYGDDYTVDDDVNDYYLKHPEMVLGTPGIAAHSGMRGGDEYTVNPRQGVSLTDQLGSAVQILPRDIVTEAPRREMSRRVYAPTSTAIRENSRVVGDDGSVYIKKGTGLESANLTASEEAKVKEMLAIRDAAKAVVDLQVRNGSDSDLVGLQGTLNKAYTAYVLANGALSAPANTDLLERDPDMPFLRALENTDALKKQRKDWTEEDQHMVKVLSGRLPVQDKDIANLQMPIFHKRIIHGLGEQPVTTFADAESVVKNETGRLDFGVMADKLGKTEDDVVKGLAEQHLIYKNPVGAWEPADQYLSGDVRTKLRQAEAAASARPREFAGNVEALRSVQPADIPAGQIGVRMGAPWIPASDINDFTKELLNARDNWRNHARDEYFKYNETTGEWQLIYKPDVSKYGASAEEYGTSRMTATQIIQRILNGKLVEVNDQIEGEDGKKRPARNAQETIAAQEKAKAIQDKFREWIWSDPERADRLAKEYNDRFNNYRPRTFDGSHQSLPGIADKWNKWLHSHQKDAVWRVVQDRTSLLAHEVGFGKTAVMVVSGMELRRMGLSRKNLYVVPKATHAQFRDQFLDIYPFARILYPGPDDFTPAKRAEFMSRAVTGDWDAIIVADSQFRQLPVKPETEKRFLEQEIDVIREAIAQEAEANDGKKSKTQKEIEKTLERALVRMENINARIADKSDKTVYFEDVGIDQMYVDEADMYKNLHFTTRMGRIKGLPNTESDRAWDMYMKTRTLQEDKHNGVVFATGTPVANTIAEMYTMMRYLQEPMLEEKGLQHFDAWAKTFGETTESLEQTPTGAYKLTQRFAKFANAPELSNMWQTVADIRVADEVPEMVKQRPRIVDEQGKAKRTVISTPPDQALLAYMEKLAKRADELKNADPREDNMLKISNDARKASLDMRLVEADAPVNPQGKIAVASAKIAEVHKLTSKDKGTQLVFLDLGTPKSKDKETEPGVVEDDETGDEQRLLKDVYGSIKAQLVADGVPEQDIAFIHDAKTDNARVQLFAKVNAGTVRVLIGSTGKMGAGVNVQKRAAALHHIDAPWRPRDIEQREGRVIRQGNLVYGPKKDKNDKVIDPGPGVRVYTYVTERSFDAYMWQAIEAKSKAIKSIMRRSAPPRSIEDIDSFTMSASEAKAVASGNPDVFKAVSLKNSVARLQMLKASHTDSKIRANAQLQAIPQQMAALNESISRMEKDTVKVPREDAKFAMTVKGTRYAERVDAGEALYNAVKKAEHGEDVAVYHDFNVKVLDQGPQSGYKLVVYNPETGSEYATSSIMYGDLTPAGVVTRVDNKVKSVPSELVKAKEQAKEHERNLTTYQKQAATAFDREDQLSRMTEELSRLERKLQGQEVEDAPVEGVAEPEDTEPEAGPEYHWGARDEEPQPVVNESAVIKAVKAEVEPVEKDTEVKPPAANIEKVIEQMDDAPTQQEQLQSAARVTETQPSPLEMAPSTSVQPEVARTELATDMRRPNEIAADGKHPALEAAIVKRNMLKDRKLQREATNDPNAGAKLTAQYENAEVEVLRLAQQAKNSTPALTVTTNAGEKPEGVSPAEPIAVKPPRTRKPRKAMKRTVKETASAPSRTELERIQAERTPRAQAMDNRKQHSHVVMPSNPQTNQWANHPGSMDVRGIDTKVARPRISLASIAFADPETRQYPMATQAQANDSLLKIGQQAGVSDEERKRIRQAIYARFPGLLERGSGGEHIAFTPSVKRQFHDRNQPKGVGRPRNTAAPHLVRMHPTRRGLGVTRRSDR